MQPLNVGRAIPVDFTIPTHHQLLDVGVVVVNTLLYSTHVYSKRRADCGLRFSTTPDGDHSTSAAIIALLHLMPFHVIYKV